MTEHEEDRSPLSRQEEEECERGDDDSLTVSKRADSSSPSEVIPVPPSVSASGISIQAHKLWIGHLDKRLTESVANLKWLCFLTEHCLLYLQSKHSQICHTLWRSGLFQISRTQHRNRERRAEGLLLCGVLYEGGMVDKQEHSYNVPGITKITIHACFIERDYFL